MSEQNKKAAVRFIEAFSKADAEAVKRDLAPDVIVTAKGFALLSGSRTYDMVVATTGAFKEAIPTGLRPTFKSVIGEGNRVAVEFEGDAMLANGESYCNQYCLVFTFEDGKIKQVNEYFCTLLADQKIGPLLSGVETQRKKTNA
jgi:ketosteroid isomerase-like protein